MEEDDVAGRHGLTTAEARQVLQDEIDAFRQRHSRRVAPLRLLLRAVRQADVWLVLLCALLLLLTHALLLHAHPGHPAPGRHPANTSRAAFSSRRAGFLVEGLLLLLNAAVNALVRCRGAAREAAERAERVAAVGREALHLARRDAAAAAAATAMAASSSSSAASAAAQGTGRAAGLAGAAPRKVASISTVLTYRDGVWGHVPESAVVLGDLVALPSGTSKGRELAIAAREHGRERSGGSWLRVERVEQLAEGCTTPLFGPAAGPRAAATNGGGGDWRGGGGGEGEGEGEGEGAGDGEGGAIDSGAAAGELGKRRAASADTAHSAAAATTATAGGKPARRMSCPSAPPPLVLESPVVRPPPPRNAPNTPHAPCQQTQHAVTSARDLLSLCGELHCYRLLETPAVRHLEAGVRADDEHGIGNGNGGGGGGGGGGVDGEGEGEGDVSGAGCDRRRQATARGAPLHARTLLEVHCCAMLRQARPGCAALLLLSVGVGAYRAASRAATESWPEAVLGGPARMLIALAPLTLPALLLLAEALGSARLMATLSVLESERGGAAAERGGGVRGGGGLVDLSELDKSDRQAVISRATAPQTTRAYLRWVAAMLRFRLCGGGGGDGGGGRGGGGGGHGGGRARVSWNGSAAAAFGSARLPLQSAQLLYQLGAVTRVCCVDGASARRD